MREEPLQFSGLELVLLAMVKIGVSTTYDLMTKAGLSVGITGRSLKRLESAKLLTSTAGSRGSQRFELTRLGERELLRFWDSVVRQESPVSFEFAIRVLYLGWLFGDIPSATRYTARAVVELRRRAQQQSGEADAIRERYPQLWGSGRSGEDQLSTAGLVSVHKFLKHSSNAEVARAQAAALENATAELEKLIPASGFRGASIQEEMFGQRQNISQPEPKRKKS